MVYLTIQFTLTTIEELHIGTGTGTAGLFDDGQYTDTDGNPCIKRDEFKGLLRQSCEEIIWWKKHYYDDKKDYKKTFDNIFSYNFRSSLDIAIDLDKNKILTNPFVIRTQTAIKDTGAALEGSLRSIECAQAGLVFSGNVSIMVPDTEVEITVELLSDALRNIKLIGGDRRRGRGMVHIEPLNVDKKTVVKDTTISDNINTSVIGLVIKLQEDTAIGGASQTGNLLPTLDYLPGTGVLGMLRSALIKSDENADILDDNSCSVSCFLPVPGDDICKIQNGSFPVVFPIPLTMRRRKKTEDFKNKPDKIPAWALTIDKKQTESSNVELLGEVASRDIFKLSKEKEDDSSDKSFKGGYLIETEDSCQKWKYYKPEITDAVRNSIDRKTQSTGDDALFIEEYLSAGTHLAGIVTFNSNSDAAKFLSTISSWKKSGIPLHVGKGSRRAEIVNCMPVVSPKPQQDIFEKDVFTLTLLSDTIVYGPDLEQCSSIDSGVLRIELQRHGFNCEPADLELKEKESTYGIVQSYTGAGGLRRFTDVAIKSGSAFKFIYKGTDRDGLYNSLNEIMEKRLGYRCNEGFGRVVINSPLHKATFNSNNEEKYYKLVTPKSPAWLKNYIGENREIATKAKSLFEALSDVLKPFPPLSSSYFMSFVTLFESGTKCKYIIGVLNDHEKKPRLKDQVTNLKKILYDFYKNNPNNKKNNKIIALALRLAATTANKGGSHE